MQPERGNPTEGNPTGGNRSQSERGNPTGGNPTGGNPTGGHLAPQVVALVPECYGGFGGIAQYNRDLMEAFSQFAEVTILPRLVRSAPGQLPPGVTQFPAPKSKLGYLWRTLVLGSEEVGTRNAESGSDLQPNEGNPTQATARLASEATPKEATQPEATQRTHPVRTTPPASRATDLIYCGHLNLLVAAWLLKKRIGAPIWLQMYGIDAWEARSALIRRMLKSVELVTSLSRYTRDKFVEWAPECAERVQVLPVTVDLEDFTPGPPSQELISRWNLAGRKVLLTVARLSASEGYKGQDRVIRALAKEKAESGNPEEATARAASEATPKEATRPEATARAASEATPKEATQPKATARAVSEATSKTATGGETGYRPRADGNSPTPWMYVIVGDGDDRPRLEAFAEELGVSDRVRLVGSVSPSKLVDWYRTADVFVMPSTGEGFGIVFIEAAACGLPVIAGNKDGSTDALLDGKLGFLVDPDNQDELLAAIHKALEQPKQVPEELEYFSKQQFARRVAELRVTLDLGLRG